MTGSAWVIGESLIDIVDRPTGRTTAPGGSPRNVAFGLSRLGVATDFSTRVGNDRHGEMIVRDLISAGGAVAHGSVTRGRTSTATARIDPGGNATYEFDIRWDWERSRPPSTAAVVHTGSIAAALGPGSDEVLSTFIELKGPAELGRFCRSTPTFAIRSSGPPLWHAPGSTRSRCSPTS